MNSRVSGRIAAIALAIVMTAVPGEAQRQDEGPAEGRIDGRVEATLTVSFVDGKSTYVPGELIPLELVFQRQGGSDFYLSPETHDRSGRLGTEQYIVTPAGGVEDPLADYLEGVPGSAGSGLWDFEPTQGSPFTLQVMLNGWVRFTKPGTYELVVTSARLQRYSGQPAPELRSNTLRLQIEPAPPGWAAAELARAEAAIESRTPEQVREGITILRHLGTREAALALVRHYSVAQSRFDVFAGLVASPYREEIVQVMEERLDTGRTLPQDYIRELAILRTLIDHPAGTIEPRARAAHLADRETEYRRRWLDALTLRMLSPEGDPQTGA